MTPQANQPSADVPELLPCPFCGKDNIRIMGPTCTRETPYNPAHRAFPVAHCWTCNTEVPGENWDSLGISALRRWNTRADRQAREEARDGGGWRVKVDE